jgi:hypothetical protein
MQITLSFDNFTELPYTSGTIQNISSQATVEICQDDTANTGLILGPGEWFSWSNSTIYARSAWDYEPTATCAVVPFKKGGEGGGELPIATKTTLGGVKIGDGLSVKADGTLSATGGGTSIDEWTAGNTYAAGDFVTHQNLLYKCTTANSDSSWTSAHWQKIGDVNFTGATISANGTNGLVPRPTTNDISKFLCGDGTWKSINGTYADKSLLWSGTHLDISPSNTIILNDNITNYDSIIFTLSNGIATQYIELNNSSSEMTFFMESYFNDSANHIRFSGYCLYSDANVLNILLKQFGTNYTSSNPCIIDVYGLKFTPNPNDYSVTEKLIGTWIDGKPLYQKTFTGTSVDGAVIPIDINIDTVVEVEGCTKISGVDFPLNYYISPSEYGSCVVGFNSETSVIDRVIYLSHSNGTRDYNITLKYTKA